jgi:hypothetical protein
MKRKRKKRAKSITSTPKKRRRSKKRAAVATPRKRRVAKRRAAAPSRRRTSARRSHRRNPAKGRKKRHTHYDGKIRAHQRRVNPSSPRKRHSRRHRRNPGIPAWAAAAGAVLAGLGSYALLGAGTYAATQRLDPSMATLQRNQYIAGGVGVVAGIAAAILGHPLIGVAVGVGGAVVLGGTDLYLGLGKLLDKAPTAPVALPAAQVKGVGALFRGGDQQIREIGMGALYRDGDQQIRGFRGSSIYRVGT